MDEHKGWVCPKCEAGVNPKFNVCPRCSPTITVACLHDFPPQGSGTTPLPCRKCGQAQHVFRLQTGEGPTQYANQPMFDSCGYPRPA